MTFNTKQGCADAQQIVRTIQSEHVEILAMQEVSSGLLDRLHDAGIEDYLRIPFPRNSLGTTMAV